jgi:potassium efflux system protein
MLGRLPSGMPADAKSSLSTMTQHRFFSLAAARPLGLFLLFFLPLSVALAQNGASHLSSAQVKEWQKTLDEAEKDLARPELSDARLAELRDRLTDLSLAARAAADAALPETQVIRDDLAALGPPPAEGAPPEAPNVVARRKALNEQLAAVEGAAKEAGLVIARADRLAADAKAQRLTRFTEHILTRGTSPLSPAIWGKALPELAFIWNVLYGTVQARLSDETLAEEARAVGRHLALGVGLAVLLAFPLRAWLIRRFGYVAVQGEPTSMQRLWAASFTGVVRALLPSAAAAAVYFSLLYGDFLSEPLAQVAKTTLVALVSVFFVAGFSRSALAPFEPAWRLVPIHDAGARAVTRSVTSLAVLFALDRVLGLLASQYNASVELISLQKFVFGVLISAELLALLRRRVWCTDENAAGSRGWQRLRYFLMMLVAAIPLSAVLGYVVLSRLMATQLVLTAGLLASVALLRRIVSEFVAYGLSEHSVLGRRLRSDLAVTEDGAEMLGFWVSGVVEFLIILLGGLALLVLWGVAEKDVSAWLQSLFFGFRVGNITISLAEVLVALALFAGLLAATRMLQKALDQRIFPRTRLDLGMRHSIRSGVGYIGFTLAVMFAVSVLGIDLSNLAIIAGALSVGIGFGLQNVVNNFVSGLILLVERPIKVGDWVVVGEHQGYVKKISVRATEITTFDRAAVFIPNSSLISGAVVNRTYADKVGRVALPLAVAYETDPKRARDILLDIALAHPDIRRNPAPTVIFRGFGESALNFELSALLHDVDKVTAVTSDLYFEIHEAFRREDIRMPFPQRDLRVSVDEAQWRRIVDGRGGAPGPS